MYIPSSMTNDEAFTMYGTLPADRIEALLEIEDIDVSGAITDIQEAACQFPAEDFLSEQMDALHDLAKKLRGDNKERLLHILQCLDDVTQCTSNLRRLRCEHLSDYWRKHHDNESRTELPCSTYQRRSGHAYR